jgi:hypothetical protein
MKALWVALLLLSGTAASGANLAHASEAVAERNELALKKVIERAEQDCKGYQDGKLIMTKKAWPRIDLTGDGNPDVIVDARRFRCSTAATLWCGTGGCPITVITDGRAHEFLAKGWKVVDWSNLRILLLEVHGSECGGTNLRNCVRAVVWSEGAFRSVGEN